VDIQTKQRGENSMTELIATIVVFILAVLTGVALTSIANHNVQTFDESKFVHYVDDKVEKAMAKGNGH
jgi:hypothetical protein